MRRCLAVLLSLFMLLQCACGSVPMEPSDVVVQEHDEVSVGNIFLADYDELWHDLRENYPFFPVLEKRGIDVEQVRLSYRSYVEQAKTLDQFMDILDRMFGALHGFAHLSLIRRDRYDLLRTDDPLRDPEQFEPWMQVLENPVTAQTYAAMSNEERSGSFEDLSLTWMYDTQTNTLLIRVPEMTPFGEERDRIVLETALSSHPDAAHIVFDLTGNTGGSTRYWEQVLVKPFGGKWQAEFRLYYQTSPINRFYYADQLMPVTEEDLPDFAADLGTSYYRNSGWEYAFGEPSLSAGADAKRWVLVDERGYSATEQFAAFCKLTGWAAVVGTRTRGDGLSGQPLLLPLERTGLLVYFTTAMAENPDGTLNQEQGVLPDFVCLPKRNQTPLELCMELIENQ